MKKYAIISLKRKLPLFIVISVIFILTAMTSVSSQEFIRTYNSYVPYYNFNTIDFGITAYLTMFGISMLVVPFFSMNYRYSLERSDTFRQAPFKDKRIRWVEHLTALIILLIAFTIGYLIIVFGFMIKNATVKVPRADLENGIYYSKVNFHYIYYLPIYFIAIAMGTFQYFITYALISRSNNFMSSFIMMLLGELTLFLLPFFCVQFFYQHYGEASGILMYGPAFSIIPIFISNAFNSLVVEGYSTINAEYAYQFIINLVVYVLAASAGIVAFFLERDPSSEFAGRGNTQRPYQEIIYHVGAVTIMSCAMILVENVIGLFFFFGFMVSMYYVFYGVLTRNFRINLKRLIIFGIVLGLVIILGMVVPFLKHPGSYSII